MAEKFAEVILPLPVQNSFTYRVPAGLESRTSPGRRVIVPFGRKKSYSALITEIHENTPSGYIVKDIESVPDDQPIVSDINLKLWRWIAWYTLCSAGEVMKAALPSGMNLESTSFITANPSCPGHEGTPAEQDYLRILGNKKHTVQEISKLLGERFSFRILNNLIRKGTLQASEQVVQRYRPRLRSLVALHPQITDSVKWNEALNNLKKAGKQKQLLLRFAEMTALFKAEQLPAIPQKQLLSEDISGSILNQLVIKNILIVKEEQVSRLHDEDFGSMNPDVLTEPQQIAFDEIKQHFTQKSVVLLHDQTVTGAVEIYLHLMIETCRQNKQVLYLVPEIGGTSPVQSRLKRIFGCKTGIYHSGMTDPERIETWYKVLAFNTGTENAFQIILGTRSSVFLPFSDLGLIIVDGEHDPSYKQSEAAPRYNARDTAVIMGLQHQTPVLLGSATPSLESYYNAKTGKYRLVSLISSSVKEGLPGIIVSDLQKVRKRRDLKSMLSPELFREINASLESGRQILLFQNRRGFSAFLECTACGAIPRCINCDVSLTWHKSRYLLVCHYCGFSQKMPETCPRCGSEEMKERGIGTEKVEQDIKALFPSARIDRLDADSARSGKAVEAIIRKTEQKKTDILIGTELAAKALDIENITLVGILNADHWLNYPDFRASERTYHFLQHIIGRLAIHNKKGTIVIQTTQPEHPVIGNIIQQNYGRLVNELMADRKLFRYPPWYRLIKIVIRSRVVAPLERVAANLAENFRNTGYFIIMGPQAPLTGRIQQWQIREIWLKTARNRKSAEVLNAVREIVDKTGKQPENRKMIIGIDIDPM